MKILKVCTFSALLLFSVSQLKAQKNPPINEPNYNKPTLFADLPASIPVQTTELDQLLAVDQGHPISTKLGSFAVAGPVISKAEQPDGSVTSVTVKITGRNGAFLNIARTGTGNDVRYRGRIISKDHKDSYELVNENGQYYLKKSTFYELVNE